MADGADHTTEAERIRPLRYRQRVTLSRTIRRFLTWRPADKLHNPSTSRSRTSIKDYVEGTEDSRLASPTVDDGGTSLHRLVCVLSDIRSGFLNISGTDRVPRGVMEGGV